MLYFIKIHGESMEYNDEKLPSMQDYEDMARAYVTSLVSKEKLQDRLRKEEQQMLAGECVNILFSIENIFKSFNNQNLSHIIDCTREQRAYFQNKFSCEERNIADNKNLQTLLCLEYEFIIKALHLASVYEDFDSIFLVILDRQKMYQESVL